jgi:hypothetical protein
MATLIRDASIGVLSKEEDELVNYLFNESNPSLEKVEIWRPDLDDASFAIAVWDDGMLAQAFFDSKAQLIGDWIV